MADDRGFEMHKVAPTCKLCIQSLVDMLDGDKIPIIQIIDGKEIIVGITGRYCDKKLARNNSVKVEYNPSKGIFRIGHYTYSQLEECAASFDGKDDSKFIYKTFYNYFLINMANSMLRYGYDITEPELYGQIRDLVKKNTGGRGKNISGAQYHSHNNPRNLREG